MSLVRRFFSFFYKNRFVSCGENLIFAPLSSSISYNKVSIGSDVFIGPRAWFRASHGRILIGNQVMFGPGVSILSGNHRFNDVGKSMRFLKKADDWEEQDIIIEDEVWIGANVVILDGVKIGRGAIVGAGSIVTKSIEPYTVSAGNPCKFIKYRFTKEEISLHEKGLDFV